MKKYVVFERMQQQAWLASLSIGPPLERGCSSKLRVSTVTRCSSSSSSIKEEFRRSRQTINARDKLVRSKKDAAASLVRVRSVARTLYSEEADDDDEEEGNKERIPFDGGVVPDKRKEQKEEQGKRLAEEQKHC